MAMAGFDPEFRDLPDYIEKITAAIWEGRGIGLIRRWYAPDCVTHTSMGPVVGSEAVVAGTLDTLNAFPDRRLLPEDVIWSGDERDGFLSSHRIMAPATHLGASAAFGEPTGRPVAFRAVADCFCLRNRVVEEWLARDQLAICAQLGLDPVALARRLAAVDAAADRAPWHLEPARRLRETGALRPPVLQAHAAARRTREIFDAIWRDTDIGSVNRAYHEACSIHVPGGRTLHGREQVCRWLFGWLSAFPDARLAIEHSIAREGEGLPTRTATRWWLTATHAGSGRFGAPSGAKILVLGITHQHLLNDLVREEWHVIDEVAVLKQIAQQRG